MVIEVFGRSGRWAHGDRPSDVHMYKSKKMSHSRRYSMLNSCHPPASRCLKAFILTCIVTLFPLLREAQGAGTEKTLVQVVFLGDSLTSGYGLSIEESYPSLITELAQKQNLPVKTVNAGVGGDTTAGALRRLNWVLKNNGDIFVVALGANDGLRGLDLDESKANLVKIVRTIREKVPAADIILMSMELPPNFGIEYTGKFRNIFPSVAESEKVQLGPFLLQNVAGNSALNQSDHLHPTAQGQVVVADTVWNVLEPLVRRRLHLNVPE